MGTTNAVVIGPSVLTFLAPSADLILRGGSTTALRNQAVIGYFSNGGGQMNGNVTGDLRISCNTFDLDNSNCGTNSYVALGFATQSSGGTATPYTINSNTIEVVANGTGINQMGRASAVGDQAYVCLGAHVNTSAGLAGQVQIQNLRVQTGGDLLMTGSNALPVTAFIPVTLGVLGGAGSTGVLEVQNLFINCLGLLSMQSGIQHNTNNHSRVEIFNGQSSSSSTLQMTINAQNLNVESSQSLLPAVGAPVDIDSRGFLTINVTQDMTMIGQTATSTATAINDLDVNVGRNFNASGPSTTALANSGGAYTLDVGNDIILGDSAFMIQAFNGTSQPYTMTAGRDIISTNTSTSFVIIQQGGAGFTNDMEIFAGRNIRLPLSTFVRKFGPGNLNIIVDNNFPTFPGIGPGGFTLGATSSVDNFGNFISGGPVRIFTARRSQNFITGFINGTLFTPGAAFVDTDLERWCAYYFNSFVGPNFTIFYKECDELLGELFRSSSAPIVTVEALRNLHPYDEYLGWPLFFDFEYREMERSPVPYFKRIDKHGDNTPKDKEVKTFNFSEYSSL
ncbi:MAG: hypothetical protein KDK76_07610 [Chlamydiia bacterium]|nr:hypothetical protein [Chlamydiia bacterium]